MSGLPSHESPSAAPQAEWLQEPATAEACRTGLLDALISTPAATSDSRASLQQFLDSRTVGQALRAWFGTGRFPDKDQLVLRLNRDVGHLDDLLNGQVNAILHHPAFQQLEASWRGLWYLADQTDHATNVKIRVLNVSWKELSRDLERAIEFDQSQMFRKVYNDEFGMPGGEPFGLLLGDYSVRHRPGPGHPTDDLATLTAASHVAAAAFAPFVAGADPGMLGLEEFSDLESVLNLPRTMDQLEYVKWKAFRDSEDSRFVGLALPRVLARLPYTDESSRVDGFCFREDVRGPDRSKYCWGTPVYAFAAVVVRAFVEAGWLADIRGVVPGELGGGLVTDLPLPSQETDTAGLIPKSSTDALITDFQEKELGELGFIPLCPCPGTEFSAFYGSQSVQKPRIYDELSATVNARLSAMLQYILCVSRFAHYIKVIGRDKIGSLATPDECQRYLETWLRQYVTGGEDLSADVKARYPLREARVQVREHPSKPGTYVSIIHLRPHYQLDELIAGIRLVTELAPAAT
jgi:type VI secretion system ImpC/EvpB family protein